MEKTAPLLQTALDKAARATNYPRRYSSIYKPAQPKKDREHTIGNQMIPERRPRPFYLSYPGFPGFLLLNHIFHIRKFNG